MAREEYSSLPYFYRSEGTMLTGKEEEMLQIKEKGGKKSRGDEREENKCAAGKEQEMQSKKTH